MAIRAPFTIGGVTLAPGTRATVDLPVADLPDHTGVNLKVEVIHGKKDGPTAFVSAAIHGDEIMGVEVVRRLLHAKALNRLHGTLLVVPVVNSFGFLNRSRYLPDRRDLNRCFPGSTTGSLASRLANIFLSDIVGRCDFGIDLHSAAVHRTNYPQVRITPGDQRTAAMAQAFGAPVVLTSSLREGSLRGEAAALGTPVLLYEAGEGLRFDEHASRAGLAGILRVLKSRGMLPANAVAAPKAQSLLCRRSTWLRAPGSGLLRTFRAEGEIVQQGDLLAAIADPTGQAEQELFSPSDGILIGRAVLPIVHEGDALFHLAELVPEAEATLETLAAQLEADPLFDEDEII